MVKPCMHLLAIITEYLCMVVAAATYGMGAAGLVLSAIIVNAIQAARQNEDDTR